MNSPVETALRQLSRSTHRIYALPVLMLAPFAGCDCRCATCDAWKGNDGETELRRWEIAGWLDEFRRLRVHQVVLCGGEPLLHPDLWGICELLKSLPVRISLLTSGLRLQSQAEEAARWCDEVVVCLDGPPEVHDEIKGVPGAFDKLAAGVASMKKVMPERRITARCSIQRHNYRLMGETVDAAWEIGLDQISFLPADISKPASARTEPADRDGPTGTVLSREEIQQFEALLEFFVRTREVEYAAGFIAESPQQIRSLARYFARLNGDGRFQPASCDTPWVSTMVEADGTVRPCSFHPPFGSLREKPLEDALNSHEAVSFRRSLDVRKNPICRKCFRTQEALVDRARRELAG